LIASLRSDPSSSVRTQIWHAAEQHGLEAVVPFGADALRDTDPGVRDAALRTLVGLAPPNLEEIVRFMLQDPDRDVQWTAYRIAADVGVLQSPDLVTLLGSGDVEKRRTAAYHLQHVADAGREALLRTALVDDDAYVRIYAVQSISALKAVGLLPALKSMLSTETDETVGINLRRTIAQLLSAGRTK
jgi:HEAT repeat protein